MDKPQQMTPQQDLCESYLQAVSSRELHNFETDDYIAFYCGLDCYDNWKQMEQACEQDEYSCCVE